ncbi:MAG TPA: flagellar hook-associated protein FlgL [Clostridia bacterium]|nr:flagellar hook-associated protein FlgL [Clostridia bacterium]
MRINPDPYPDLLVAINRAKRLESQYVQQLASGRRISTPSDDPTASALLVRNQSRQAANDEFLHNNSSVAAGLRTADATLSSAVLALQRAVTLGVQGANGTLSNENRIALAGELHGIVDQMLSLANTSFRGSYIFAGTASKNAPFVGDDTVPGGVRYDGNSTVNEVQVGETRFIAANVPGRQIFNDPSAHVFEALNELTTAMEAGDQDQIAAATGRVRAAFDHITSERVFYGNTLNQLEAEDTFLDGQTLEIKTAENDLAGADPLEATAALLQARLARDAALAATGKASMLSLLDFLK